MKVRVSMPGAYMAMELEDGKALAAFRKMTELLCSYGAETVRKERAPAAGLGSPERLPEPEGKDPEAEEPYGYKMNPEDGIPAASVKCQSTVPENPEKIRPPKAVTKYSGFLYVRCPECGGEKGFAVKKEKASDHYHCDNCGERTEFKEPLVPLYVNCECGRSFRYMTNMTEDAFDINCLGCGAPVAVRWNEKKGLYETIR